MDVVVEEVARRVVIALDCQQGPGSVDRVGAEDGPVADLAAWRGGEDPDRRRDPW